MNQTGRLLVHPSSFLLHPSEMSTLLDRFCRYVRIDTQADETSGTCPSSPGQLELGRLLVEELRALGLRDTAQDSFGIVLATIPATSPRPAPTIAWNAHVDTSPETSGHGVQPIVHRDYDGGDLVLPGDRSKVLRVADNPDLARLKGRTIITTDGTTLLGSDDKSGVAVIMEAAAHLVAHPEIVHGPIRVCFTCDEEIGHGVDHLDLEKLGARVAYTLDGGGTGEIDTETFSADLAVVTIRGVNIHPSIARGKMVNAVRLAGLFLDRLPRQALSPETTAEREGFLHPYRIEGGVGEVTLRVLLRDFDTSRLAERAELLRAVARLVEAEYPPAAIDVRVTPQYRNMADGLAREPRAVAFAEEAMRRVGLEPKRTIVRGGTDGSRLTEMGLPTPNLSTGEHNLHSPLEWTCLEEMETAVRVLVELAQVWAAA
jgi:tripeptide aminopeptidase